MSRITLAIRLIRNALALTILAIVSARQAKVVVRLLTHAKLFQSIQHKGFDSNGVNSYRCKASS